MHAHTDHTHPVWASWPFSHRAPHTLLRNLAGCQTYGRKGQKHINIWICVRITTHTAMSKSTMCSVRLIPNHKSLSVSADSITDRTLFALFLYATSSYFCWVQCVTLGLQFLEWSKVIPLILFLLLICVSLEFLHLFIHLVLTTPS